MKYRKKPVVIDAAQFDGKNGYALEQEFGCDSMEKDGKPYLQVVTLEGTMRGDVGDWVIRGVKGEIYFCKPDIFAATYEPATSPSPQPDSERGGTPETDAQLERDKTLVSCGQRLAELRDLARSLERRLRSAPAPREGWVSVERVVLEGVANYPGVRAHIGTILHNAMLRALAAAPAGERGQR